MSMLSPREKLFAKIAVHNKLATKEEVESCALLKDTVYSDLDLGQILLKKGIIKEKHHRAVDRTVAKQVEKLKAAGRWVEEEPPAEDDDEIGFAPPDPEEGPRGADDSWEEIDAAPARPASASARSSASARPAPSAGAAVAAPAATVSPVLGKTAPEFKAVLRRFPQEAQKVLKLLQAAKAMGASDLHLSCGARPFVRHNGQIKFFEAPVLTARDTEAMIPDVFPEVEKKRLLERLDLDTCLEVEGLGRFRANALKQRRGFSGVFRVIKERIPTLEDLGLPDALEKFTTYHQGLVLVTGPAGSGKSSTLAALIEIINQNRREHIITLEDPIEYVFECRGCNISQRQVERHTESWGIALRASLREDPDVIMVGEMRDLDTISLAITAAETGHLVLGTLHTTNATRTIDRMLDVFPPKEQPQIRAMVSESLRGVVSQQLVPRADGTGRVPALEVMFTTPAVSNLIREKRTFQLFSVLQTGKKLGMRLMDDSLKDLVRDGLITFDEARFRAQNPKTFA